MSNINDFHSILDSLQRNLNLLSAKALDVEEQIKIAEMSGKKKRKKEVELWLVEVQKIERAFMVLENKLQSEGFVLRFLGGGRVANMINEKVDKLVEQSRYFGEPVLGVYQSRGEALLTTRLEGEAFEENLERILKLLVADKVSSIGIYGMGGVGKTTLTKHIHNQLLEKTQECVFWVTVSQEISIKMLQDKIACDIGLKFSDEHDEDKRAAELNRALSMKKNIVLILDDVWKDINLEKVGDPLRVEGCRLIITTRSLKVCHQMRCQQTVEVKTLHDNEAWNLFRETLGEETKLTPQVEEIAKSMVKLCDGLPLGIITLAGSMRDYYIRREELVRKFISEGLVDERKNRKAQIDEGHSTLKNLVNVCLLENTNEGEHVKMHDLVRAMALKITQGKNIVIAGHYSSLREVLNEKEWTTALEKMSLMNNHIQVIPNGMSPNCPNLSTLLLNGNQFLDCLPDSFFSQLHGLCNLDLSETKIKQLPNSLSDLDRLEALILGKCKDLEYVPYLGKLKALRELDLSYTGIKELPQGMENLVNLKCLWMNGMKSLQLPTGILLNFPHIQCLHLPLKIHAPVEGMERLKKLEEFVAKVKDVGDFNRFVRATQGWECNTCYDIQIGSTTAQDDLWSYRSYSKVVTFYKYDLKKGEEKDVSMLAHNIQHLKLWRCEGLSNSLSDDFLKLNNPTSLASLIIQECKGIEYIVKEEQLMMTTLEEIHPSEMHDFMGVMYIGGGTTTISSSPPQQAVFSSLKLLTISDCDKMKKLGLPAVSHLQLAIALLVDVIPAAGPSYSGCVPRYGALDFTLLKLHHSLMGSVPRYELFCFFCLADVCGLHYHHIVRYLKILFIFVLPCFAAESAYKIWWYNSGGTRIPFLGNVTVRNTVACMLELCSWFYRTVVVFLICVLFRLICFLQFLLMQNFALVFQVHSDVESVLREHLRIRSHLRIISHLYRVFILCPLTSITVSQFASLLMTTRPNADVNIYHSGELAGAISAPMYSMKGPPMVQSLYPTAFPLKHQQKA
ncbi:hypothetical protein DH2020_038121 [Rehmannia glutinosa]|uniref:AAA+ ATPase domain-containing protein n=1 Tax=Rehmannia glutinosa TaxID=99300 RepID=A0ABR0V0Q6_REHGL